ncbi:MAG TPA: hypothetical protein VKF40_22700 [Burkholderiales bacterium]|nr:hypothetical protein [Burkholderiales bacterium]
MSVLATGAILPATLQPMPRTGATAEVSVKPTPLVIDAGSDQRWRGSSRDQGEIELMTDLHRGGTDPTW